MSDKYIITNCPSCRDFDVFGLPNKGCCYNFNDYCSRHNECVLKQIVDKCKKEIKIYRKTLLPNDGTNTIHFGRQSFAYDVLKLLDIQEVE